MLTKKTLRAISYRSCLVVICFGALAINSGCNNTATTSQTQQNSSTTVTNTQSNDLATAVVSDFATQVVIPTYQWLETEATELTKAVNTFVANPNDDSLQAAQQAWLATRNPWEQSEAFAFGPAESLGYDGDLDDWPVNETDVTAILNSKDALTPEYIKELQTTQKGFHTIELLMFGSDNDKTASDFSSRELELLKNLTVAFQQTATDLTTSWTTGVDDNPPYQEVLASAGDSSNPAYPTVNAAVEEIVQGIIACLDEVANEKIGEPLKTQENIGLESRFSHSSVIDFQNNLQGVQNAYLGSVSAANTSGQSVSNLVAKADPQLDQKIKGEIEAAIQAVKTIPSPIETQLTEPEVISKMESAQTEILTLLTTMEEQVLPIVQS
ncbi:MAG: imelysin family protein [Pleurocapsa sp.]